MRGVLRGALLSVLFFALLIGGAPGVAVAQYADGVTDSDTSSDDSDDGDAGAGNPHSNPLGGDLTGGMGDPAPVEEPVINVGTIEKGMLKAKIANVCVQLAEAETRVKIAVLLTALAALVVAAVNIPGAGVLLAAAAVGFAGYDVAMSWCNNDFPRW